MINLTYSEGVFLLELLEELDSDLNTPEEYSEDIKNAIELLQAYIVREEGDGGIQKFQRRKSES